MVVPMHRLLVSQMMRGFFLCFFRIHFSVLSKNLSGIRQCMYIYSLPKGNETSW